MSSLSVLALVLALAIGVYLRWLAHRPNVYISNQSRLLAGLAILGLLVLAVRPDTVNFFLEIFSFTPGNGSRLIGLTIFAIFVMFLWNLQLQAQVNASDRTIDRLIRELTKHRFRPDRDVHPLSAPICVVIPAYNEADNIGHVLDQMPTEIDGRAVEVLVVEDGGTDATAAVVRDHKAHVVSHVINRGGGAALQVGFDLALESKAAVIVTLDADGQHLPQEMPRLVTPVLAGEADMVNGSRVLGTYEKDKAIRAMGVVVFNWLISALTWQRITDCSNSYRAFSADALRAVRPHLHQRQYHTTEFLIEMIKRGQRVMEVPITIRRRMSGESKKGHTLRYSLGFTRAILKTWFR